VDVPTFLGLVEGLGLGEEPGLSKLLPYLHAVTSVAGGGDSPGAGVARLRIVAGLQHAE
jgi:hypothetical protein